MAKVIMVQGTMSNSGKSVLVPYFQTGRIQSGTV